MTHIIGMEAMRLALTVKCEEVGGVRTLARQLDISHKHLQDMVKLRRPITPIVAHHLGYRKVWAFELSCAPVKPGVH